MMQLHWFLTYAEINYDIIYDEEIVNGNFRNTTGYTFTMKILPASLENSGELTNTCPGTSRMLP